MSKAKTIDGLVRRSGKRVYVYLSDKKIQERFISDADTEGYTFEDGTKLSERIISDFYALNRNNTVNFINFIGRIAFQSNAEHIIRVDYKKYINGNEDYYE